MVASLLEMDNMCWLLENLSRFLNLKDWSWNAMQCKRTRHRPSLTLLFHTWTQPVQNDRACQYRQIIMNNVTFFLQWQLSQNNFIKPGDHLRDGALAASRSISVQLCSVNSSQHPVYACTDAPILCMLYQMCPGTHPVIAIAPTRAKQVPEHAVKWKDVKKKTQENKERWWKGKNVYWDGKRGKGKKKRRRRLGRKSKKRTNIRK